MFYPCPTGCLGDTSVELDPQEEPEWKKKPPHRLFSSRLQDLPGLFQVSAPHQPEQVDCNYQSLQGKWCSAKSPQEVRCTPTESLEVRWIKAGVGFYPSLCRDECSSTPWTFTKALGRGKGPASTSRHNEEICIWFVYHCCGVCWL